MKKLFITAFTLFTAVVANAQKKAEYVILTGSTDTLKCSIKKEFLGTLKYKPGGSETYNKIKPDQIGEYYYRKDDAPMRSIIMPNQSNPTFLKVLEDGPITLYEFDKTYYTGGAPSMNGVGFTMGVANNSTRWYVTKVGRDTLMEIKSNQIFNSASREDRKQIFAELIADKKEVADYHASLKKFSFEYLREVIHYYNTGKAPEPKDIIYPTNY